MEVVGPRSASAIPKQETCFTTIWRHFIGSGRSQAVWISPGPEEYVYAGKYRPSKSPLISYRSPVISVSSNGGGRLRWTQWLIDGSFWAQIWTRDTLGDASAQMTELLCEPVRICAQNEPTLSRRSHSVSPPQVDETEITGDHTEINGDSRVLFLLTRTCAPDPGDIHTARDRRERIKWRQTVPCSAHVLKQPNQPLSPPTPHRLQSNISQDHQRATGW